MTNRFDFTESPLPDTGFAPPRDKRRAAACAELIATLALVLCTLPVAAMLSIGAAHAAGVTIY